MAQIRIVVEDEQILYSTFSPEVELNEFVKGYIRSKIRLMDHSERIDLAVISKEPLDEERFRSAMSKWGEDELALLKMNYKDTFRMLIGTLILGSVMLILNLLLQKRSELVQYTLIPIISGLALGRAAGILAIDLPTYGAKKQLINEMRKNSLITFEYGHDKNDSGSVPTQLFCPPGFILR